MLLLEFQGYNDNSLDWVSNREGWTYWDERISEESVRGVFMATTEWLEAPPADWTPFDSFPDVQEEHELTVGDGYIFVKDPQQEFQRYSEGSTRMGYYLGIVLF